MLISTVLRSCRASGETQFLFPFPHLNSLSAAASVSAAVEAAMASEEKELLVVCQAAVRWASGPGRSLIRSESKPLARRRRPVYAAACHVTCWARNESHLPAQPDRPYLEAEFTPSPAAGRPNTKFEALTGACGLAGEAADAGPANSRVNQPDFC